VRLPTTLAVTFAATAVATAAISGAADEPTDELVAAVADASNPVAIDRAARRLSTRQLTDLIGMGRAGTRAAVFAASLAIDSFALLSPLADIAGGYDRSLAVPAARAARAIAGELDTASVAELEIPRRTLAEAAVAWHRVARDRQVWADVRVSALEVARDLTALLSGDGSKPVIELVTDPDAEVRRAALELLESPLAPARYPRVVDRLTGDSDPEVALAAAAALCFGVRFGDDAASIRAAAGEAGLERIAELAADASLPGPARVAAAGCLTGARELAAVRRSLPASLRRQLAAGREP
jgi:hypothetical protein